MSRVFRMVSLDTAGRDLVLSSIGLYSGLARLSGSVMSCSHAPVQGTLSAVDVASGSNELCVFAAMEANSPGFYIQWEFTADVDPWCVRMSSPHPLSLPRQYALGYRQSDGRWVWSQHGRVLTPEPEVLTLATSSYPAFGIPLGWRVQTGVAAASLGFAGCSLSSTGQSAVVAGYGSGAVVSISNDGGLNWSTATGPVPDTNGFYGAAISRDGRSLIVAGVGSSNAKTSLSKDGGTSWSMPSGLAVGVSGFAGCAVSSDGEHMAVAGFGSSSARINLSHDGGLNWVQPSGPIAGSNGFIGVAISDDGQTIVSTGVGSSSAVVSISRDGGGTWSVVGGLVVGASGFAGCALSADGLHMVIAGYGTSAAKINVSHDGGLSWVQASGPLPDTAGFIGVAISDDGQSIVAAAYGSAAARLSVSRDGGSSWSVPIGQTVPPSGYIWCAMSADGRLLLAAQSGSAAANIAQLLVADHSYGANDLGTNIVRAQVLPGAQMPMQGIGTTALNNHFALDTEFAGAGQIYGTVKDHETNQLLQRRVRLFRSRDGLLVRETWSAADGSYCFEGISERYEYDIEAWDHEKNYFTVVANNQLPEVAT